MADRGRFIKDRQHYVDTRRAMLSRGDQSRRENIGPIRRTMRTNHVPRNVQNKDNKFEAPGVSNVARDANAFSPKKEFVRMNLRSNVQMQQNRHKEVDKRWQENRNLVKNRVERLNTAKQNHVVPKYEIPGQTKASEKVKTVAVAEIELTKHSPDAKTELKEKCIQPTKNIATINEKFIQPAKNIATTNEKFMQPTKNVTTIQEKCIQPTKNIATTNEKFMQPTKNVITTHEKIR